MGSATLVKENQIPFEFYCMCPCCLFVLLTDKTNLAAAVNWKAVVSVECSLRRKPTKSYFVRRKWDRLLRRLS